MAKNAIKAHIFPNKITLSTALSQSVSAPCLKDRLVTGIPSSRF